MKRKRISEINAGSMADIAFLLLIFFLVTTTMDVDKGIFRKMPQKDENAPPVVTKNKNILDISINRNNEIWLGNEKIALGELHKLAIDFIDNGGGTDKNGRICDWCNGAQKSNLSDHPTKAIISISADRKANYETYVTVMDAVNSAYSSLRNKLCYTMFNKNYKVLEAEYKKTRSNDLLRKIKLIQEKYPLLIADIESTSAMAQM